MTPTDRLLTGFVLPILLGGGWATNAWAAGGADPEAARCLAALDADDPQGALAAAARGTGAEAAECRALATAAAGDPAGGAVLLERLAAHAAEREPPADRAALWAEAADSWIEAGENARAESAANQALAVTPGDTDALLARARARLAAGRPADAEADLDGVLAGDAHAEEALVLRASARRGRGALDGAAADLDRALALDAQDPEALLERGIVRLRRGDAAGARADWQRAAELAPDSDVADRAEQNLALLAAGPEE